MPTDDGGTLTPHELVTVFAELGLPLNATLKEMLGEHFSHRTERRGCGYTQSSRHLAVLVNRPPGSSQNPASQIFPGGVPSPLDFLQKLNEVGERLEREESRVLLALIRDLVLPAPLSNPTHELPPFFGEIKVGSCPLAEKYFLELTDGFVRRKGRINIFVSDSGQPLVIEKLNLGDNHSCINVTEVVLNGVRLPPGCLFGVERAEELELKPNQKLPGSIIPVQRCAGFRFLRLTTLAISPAHRRRAFTAHFQSQLDAGLFAPGEATIDQLRRVAEAQL
jgi:hypothetical protein